MAIKEQDIVLVEKDEKGNKVIQMPITRVENVEGAIKTVNKVAPDATGNVAINTVANATKATQDASGNVITTTYATKTELSKKLDTSSAFTKTQADNLYLGKTAKAVSAGTADTATKATQDGTGKVIATTYATKTEVTQGLAGKASTAHTHTKSQITDFPEIPDTSTLIPKSGNRGSISGWEASGRYTATTVTITKDSPDTLTENVGMLPATGVEFTVPDGDSATTFTKVVKVYNTDTFSLGGNWKWAGNKAPEMKQGFVVLHWNNDAGVANLIAME